MSSVGGLGAAAAHAFDAELFSMASKGCSEEKLQEVL